MENVIVNRFKGRGAQLNTGNKFLKNTYVSKHIEGIDEPLLENSKTEFLNEFPKTIVNKVESPDLGLMYSMNPYQGCEHGCIYCYARNSHEFWGYSAGLDFERKIIVKRNAASLLDKYFRNPKWNPYPIMLSGNTDCYQPIERKLEITRHVLEVFLKYRNPVSIITKNSLILRDLDILKKLAKLNLVHVSISITSMEESTRLILEPRTATIAQRFKTVEELSNNGIPVNVMVAPIIPGLNHHEIPSILRESAARGAQSAAYTIVRLNGSVAHIFEDWIKKHLPERAEKVLHQIADCHGGKLYDNRYGTRMSGEGNIAGAIGDLFRASYRKHFHEKSLPPFDLSQFRSPGNAQMQLGF